MSSLFDYEDTSSTKLDLECIYNELRNIPLVYKPVYSQVWYDVIRKYMLDNDISFMQKVIVYSTFMEVPVTWKLRFNFSFCWDDSSKSENYVNVTDNNATTDANDGSSVINRVLHKLISISESQYQMDKLFTYHGSLNNYWKDFISQFTDTFIGAPESHMMDQDILNKFIRVEYRHNPTTETLTNAREMYDTYMEYVEILLKENGIVTIKETD